MLRPLPAAPTLQLPGPPPTPAGYLYQKYGDTNELWNSLDGIFACVIWDERTGGAGSGGPGRAVAVLPYQAVAMLL